MKMLNVSFVMNDPRFAQTIPLIRASGVRLPDGNYQKSTSNLTIKCVVQPSKADDVLKYLPEGERQDNAISIHSATEIRMGDGNGQESDVVIWNGGHYRVAFAKNWKDFGYWFAIAQGFDNG